MHVCVFVFTCVYSVCVSACILHINISFKLLHNNYHKQWFRTTHIYYLMVFYGSGIWIQVIWVINLGFYKAAINISARAVVSSEV